MRDPFQLRLNDDDFPDRSDRFEKALKKSGATAANVLREMADAYLRYCDAHGRPPTFPVELIGPGEKAAMREDAPLYQPKKNKKH